MSEPENQSSSMSLWEVTKSVSAAFFGVQTEKNRQRDFQNGKASHFIIIGLVATIVFIVVLWGIVQIVLKAAGA